jgi:23S rRNA pseudoU1915 N3-methylase RlmH
MNDEQIQGELVDEEIQAEPVIDEFTLARLAEAAEYEDRLQKAKAELKELRAAAEDRDRTQADAQFAEARRLHPHLSVHQIAAMLDEPGQQYVNAVQINAIQT